LTAARREARKGFDTSRYLSETDAAVTAGIAHANDVARILRQNVVQGKQVDNGDDDVASYSMSFPLCHLWDWWSRGEKLETRKLTWYDLLQNWGSMRRLNGVIMRLRNWARLDIRQRLAVVETLVLGVVDDNVWIRCVGYSIPMILVSSYLDLQCWCGV
jgi:hypothetical protein